MRFKPYLKQELREEKNMSATWFFESILGYFRAMGFLRV